MRRGHQIKITQGIDVLRAWQQDCAAAINQLSGGSKAHWLSRAYSNAFLVRSGDGGVVVEAETTEIVDRILRVLEQGVAALLQMDPGGPEGPPLHSGAAGGPDGPPPRSSVAPRPRRFDFVHNADLRPVLERAFDDSRTALERHEFGLSLILSSGLIDALLTDALDHARPRNQVSVGALLADWSFEMRIAEAERVGLIRGGCARLPPVARTYRDLTDAEGNLRAHADVTEREARLAGQVLRVVMRDLDPGR